MAQSLDSIDNDLPDKPKKEGIIHSQPKRTFDHEIQSIGSRSAATTPQAPTTVLTQEQLKQCGYSYINNGIVRGVVDRSVFFIQGERTKAVVEANDELIESTSEDDLANIEQEITDDTLTIEADNEAGIPAQEARINDLKRKMVRLNKRVKLHENTEKGLISSLVFGRGFLEIVRLPIDKNWPIYGEPIALKHLTTKNIIQCYFNERTGIFEGLDYNTGKTINPVKLIKATDLIPFFHDDNNILENTQGSGLSAVWPILSVSQADDVINDEDIPEICKNTGGVLTVIKAATNDDTKLTEIRNKANGKTQLVVGQGIIDEVSSYPLGRDPHELTDVRTADGKYICQCMNLPLFLMYEDTANFATANQTMQVYKAGILKRYRTWLQGILEDYWYDTILADHLNIEIKNVIAAPIKIKAIFADINFETRKEVIEADKLLNDMGVMDETDIAKDIDRKDLVNKLEAQQADQQKQQDQAVTNAFQQQRNQILQLQQQNQNQLQQKQQVQQQQASAAASTKNNEEEYHKERLSVFANMQKVLKDLAHQ